MKKIYALRFMLFSDGKVKLTSDIFEKEYSLLHAFTYVFPNVKQLSWIKELIEEEANIDSLSYTGLNTFKIGVERKSVHLSHNYDPDLVQTIPLTIVNEFIDDCIELLDLFNSGKIPGIIPESKKDDWVIVPKRYVDKGYLEKIEAERKEGDV